MNTGQMLLTTGALILMGTTIITINRMYNRQGDVLHQTEIGVYAVSLATSLLEEASGQNFDEATVNDAVTSTSSLSNTLGPESGEKTSPDSTVHFDDFDDYNNLIMGFRIQGVDSFTVKANVYYINDSDPSTPVSTRTWFKRMDVSVSGSASADTVKMSYIFSYFNFR
jgi:hypothetical protein